MGKQTTALLKASARPRPRKMAQAVLERYIFDYIQTVYEAQEAGRADVPTLLGLQSFIEKHEAVSHRALVEALKGKNGALFEALSADLLSRGGVLGLYNASMTALTLKNRCHWRDKIENTDTPKDTDMNIKIKVI